jgi:CRP/FNR family transcriptional regulator/CRP/FNR family cyclic AMP-dependent transcriptional regulator
MSKQLIELIKDTAFAEGLGEEQLLKLSERFEIKALKQGDAIVRAGELTRDLCILIEGNCSVEIEVTKYEGYFEVGLLSPGDTFGEMSFLDGKPRSATIICKTPCEVAVLGFENFNELTMKMPEIREIITRNLALIFAEKVREIHDRFRNLYWKGLKADRIERRWGS